MGESTDRIRQLASEAGEWLERRPKPGGRSSETIVTIRDGAPDWVESLCHHAHGDMMPDDWRYEFIDDALSALADGAEEDGVDLDTLYPYTADRLAWLASQIDRYSYCDEAADDFGAPPKDIMTWVAWGMARELAEVYDLIRSRLAELAELAEEQDDD